MKFTDEMFQAIFASSPIGICVCDMTGRFILSNPALCDYLGYTEPQLLEKSYRDVVHPDDINICHTHFSYKAANDSHNKNVEIRFIHGSDKLLAASTRFSFFRAAPDEPMHMMMQTVDLTVQKALEQTLLKQQGEIASMTGTLQDISARKKTEDDLLYVQDQLRLLSAHQETSVEEERKHIAREIHDDMGQKLAALQMGLTIMGARHGDNQTLARQITELQAIVSDSIDVVRHVSTRLRPPALDLGLLPAIEWLAEDFRHRWEVDCHVDIQGGDIVFSEPIAAALYRVVQESLNNVAKHAAATQVMISMIKQGNRVSLSIADDGCGFDPAAARERLGFGLLGMKERVLALGGTLKIISNKRRDSHGGPNSQGTQVAIELPLQEATV